MIYPSLYQSLLGMKKDDENLFLYRENYTKRLEQITLDPASFKEETNKAVEFILENRLLFPKEIDYAVLITEIENSIDDFIDYDFFTEPDLPEEIKDISEEDE